ncbi:MAG: hypothetical protein JWM86_1329 [Thermoleophilia bacterium]|nr:hypothetical protein [Thermoleophilia bacterium]
MPPARVAEVAASKPFGTDAPEATFSLAQLRDAAPVPALHHDAPVVQLGVGVGAASQPSDRGIRVARAAAAARTPVAAVRIPAAEVEGGSFMTGSAGGQPALPGMEQLVERVRQRTAARMSRASALTPA